jgi:hypothetical protein
MPSKHHRRPEGVWNVAIDATDPSPTTPSLRLGLDTVAGERKSSNAREQSATVALADGPPTRENPYHETAATTMSRVTPHNTH